MEDKIQEGLAKPMKAGDSAPPRETEQEKKKQENAYVTQEQFNSWTSSFEANLFRTLERITSTNVSAAPAPFEPAASKDTSKSVRMQEPLRTPDSNEGRPSRPSEPSDFYIAPTIEFERRIRERDSRMDLSYNPIRDARPRGLLEQDEDQYRRHESDYNTEYNRDEEIFNFRRARDAREVAEAAAVAASGTVRKKPPRESAIKRAIRSVDTTINEVQVTKVQPEYDQIMLHKLDVLPFAKWSDQIVEYTNINKISLPVPTMVTQEIRNFLISHEASLTRANWTRLTAEEVFSLISGHLRPKSKLEFYNKLKENVEFQLRYKSTPTSGNFEHFYNALLLYQEEFTLVFDVLAERNEHNIPPITTKENVGLIHLFAIKIDTGSYAKNVIKTMGSEKFDDMHDFLDRFYGIVKSHYKVSLGSKDLNEILGGSSYFRQAAESYAVDARKKFTNSSSNYSSSNTPAKRDSTSGYNKPSSYSSNSWTPTRGSTPARSTHRLHHMLENVEDASDEETAFEQQVLVESIMAAAIEKSGGYDTIGVTDVVRRDDDDDVYDTQSARDKAVAVHDYEADIETQLQNVNDSELAMIQATAGHSRAGFGRSAPSMKSSTHSQPHGKKESHANGCYTMLLHGECKKSDCRFSHDMSALLKTWTQCAKLLAASKFKPHDSERRVSTMSHMVIQPSSSDDIDDEENMFDPKLAELRHNMLLAAMPEVSLHSSMHREGMIFLLGDNFLTVEKALFDTGALHDSYISSSFVAKHAAVLAPYIRKCNRMVYLADHKTRVPIDRIALLTVNFVGDDSVEHTVKMEFSVFDTESNDMIIGLPAILTSFRVLFREMLDAAIDAAAAVAIISHVVEEADSVPIVDKVADINVSSSAAVACAANSVANNFASNTTDVVYPWSKTVASEAPEDIATETPCSFAAALHFMEMPYEDLVKDYHKMFESHVSPDFLEACPQLLKLLKNKALKVFVPPVWEGIKGMEPLELDWKDTMVSSLKPASRFVNPKLYSTAEVEFNRLKKYLLRPSTSPIASPLVIAPKATNPFIRLCGDYVAVNKFINIGHYPIPNVPYSLEKICHFRVFIDLDMTNSFHQFRLAALTASRLSWQTPWGQYEPVFMPEGIGPASGVLQKAVSEIFADFGEWMICIFDNLLILAMDYQDAYKKLELVLDRCIERNVCLKFSKSWLGFDHANFFGYVCKYQRYELSDSRKEALAAIPFPSTLKKMQSFLGAALFCKSFIPHYSTLTAPLSDMTKQGFSWNESTWIIDYRKVFQEFKERLVSATSIFYPDYSLDWILRTDASLYGVGAMLLQVYRSSPDAEPQYQPIGFASQKFSPQAQNWSTIEQEAYGIYFAVKHFSYYLHCKQFILETDHNNLLWMEASAVPKIIRWRVYLQSFNFMLRHIRGKDNGWADLLSRVHEPEAIPSLPQKVTTIASIAEDDTAKSRPRKILVRSGKITVLTPAPTTSSEDPILASHHQHTATEVDNVDALHNNEQLLIMPNESAATALAKAYDVIRQVHNTRVGHHGVRNTYRLLNTHFPGHRIPWRVVNDFVSCCAWCQKDRLGMADSLQPIVRHIKPVHRRSIVGADSLTITPPDKYGNWILIAVVNHMTKFAALYAAAKHDAETTASALFQFYCSYGMFDSILTDPGSEFMNDVVKHLTRWLGVTHKVSLVERHESNGVEGTNKQILRHLKALVMEERVKDRWSSPTILPAVQFLINNNVSSETGVTPFHATFGSIDATYGRMGEGGDGVHRVNAYIRLLDDNLRLLSDITKKHQAKLISERTSQMPPHKQNQYQPGDYVLWQLNPDEPLPSKLTPKFLGPFEVITQYKNDVTCKHIVLGNVKVFHVTRLKIFHGSRDEAIRIAKLDNDQFTIRRIIAYRGDPTVRTTLEFEIEFEDDSVVWLPWSKDIFDTVQYEDFCRSRSELFLLIHSVKAVQKILQDLRKTPITEVQPGDIAFVDLRCYGSEWYNSLPLPDKYHITYLLEYQYTRWIGKSKLKIEAACKSFAEKFALDHVFVKSYGSTSTMPTGDKYKLINAELIKQYPLLLPNATST